MSKLVRCSWAFILSFLILVSTGCIPKSNVPDPDAVMIEHLRQSTVALVYSPVEGEAKDYSTYCGGVWMNDTTILTAYHCVAQDVEDESENPIGDKIQFKTWEEMKDKNPGDMLHDPHTAIVAATDRNHDLALIIDLKGSLSKIKIPEHSHVTLSTKELADGIHVQIVGHPKGFWFSYMPGVVSQAREIKIHTDVKVKVFQITTAAYYGNSGGGVFDSDGHLIGICSFLIRGLPSTTFFIHRDSVEHFLFLNDIN